MQFFGIQLESDDLNFFQKFIMIFKLRKLKRAIAQLTDEELEELVAEIKRQVPNSKLTIKREFDESN